MTRRFCLVIVMTMILGMVSSCSKEESSPTKKKKAQKTTETEITETETEIETESEEKTTTVSLTEETTTATSESVIETNSGDQSVRSQRNEFNKTTNQTVIVGSYEFSLPLYWMVDGIEDFGWSGHTGTTSSFSTLTITVSKYETAGVYDDLEEDVKNGVMARSISSSFDRSGDVEARVYTNQAIKGFMFTNEYTLDGHEGFSVILAFVSEDDTECYYVWLMQDAGDEYQYTDDFMRILNNIRMVEEIMTPTPSPTPTPKPTKTPTPTPTPKPTKTPTPSPTPKSKKHTYEYAYKYVLFPSGVKTYYLFDTDKQEFAYISEEDPHLHTGKYVGSFEKDGKVIMAFNGYEYNLMTCYIYDGYIEIDYRDGGTYEYYDKVGVYETDALLGDYGYE